MNVSAKADYGMRALLELAVAYQADPRKLVKGEAIATAQGVPLKFLEGILRELRQAGIVASQRGAEGGYRLDREPKDVTIADVARALDGPLAAVRGQRPEDLEYQGASEHLREVWIAVRVATRHVLENISLADVASGRLPRDVSTLLKEPGAWAAPLTVSVNVSPGPDPVGAEGHWDAVAALAMARIESRRRS